MHKTEKIAYNIADKKFASYLLYRRKVRNRNFCYDDFRGKNARGVLEKSTCFVDCFNIDRAYLNGIGVRSDAARQPLHIEQERDALQRHPVKETG